MRYPQNITDAIANLIRKIGRALKKIIIRFINFVRDIVNWFKKLNLNQETDTPFIFDASKMQELINDAPIVDCGIFEGVYNEETNMISHHRLIETEEVDPYTQDLLKKSKNGMVILQ